MASLSICSVTIGGTAPVGNVPGVGGATYYFKGSTCYANLADQTGVTVIAKKDWGNDEPIIPVAALELPGKVLRVIAPYTVKADGTGKIKYAELVIDRAKLQAIEAKNSLKGKEYKVTDNAGSNGKTLGFFQNNGRVRRRAISVL
jgi:hypothetical protein